MSLLFRVLFAHKCTSTHHKLAMDALRMLQSSSREKWTNLFLHNIEIYLDGAKAPDKKFKDFRNHVLHVRENFWGGAVVASERWYARLIDTLKKEDWPNAVFAAGVLSHYVSDAFMPLHTGQTEAEGAVHRAIEWGCAKAYSQLVENFNADDAWPDIELPAGSDWLALTVVEGAQYANRYYETLIDHYSLEAGSKNPADGFDDTSAAALTDILGRTVVTWSRILDRVFDEAGVTPPDVNVSLSGFLTSVTIPIFWVTKNLANAEDKKAVRAIYREVQMRGKALQTLPEDERDVRAKHADEVLGVELSVLDDQEAKPSGSKFVPRDSRRTKTRSARKGWPERDDRQENRVHSSTQEQPETAEPVVQPVAESEHVNFENAQEEREQRNHSEPRAPRFYLALDDPVVDAPSIGGGTAKRLKRARIRRVRDLLDCDPEAVAEQANAGYITVENIQEWQRQAKLMCTVPGLRGHDSQILVACDLDDPTVLAELSADDLLAEIEPFVNSSEGERVIRDGRPPDHEEVSNWIQWAGQARPLSDAA